MQHSINPCSKQTVTAPCQPTFNLFIACEDAEACLQARRIEDQIEALCGDEINISRVFWSFALLCHDKLRRLAAKDAASAQMMIISMSRGGTLPAPVKSLLESLPVQSPSGEAALVALLGPDENLQASPPPSLSHLRQIADSRGLDFFCNKSVTSAPDISEEAHLGAQAADAAPPSVAAFGIPWVTGGINE